MKDGYLVFLDSGIGGMTTMRAVMQLLPSENYAYFCDTKNVPYGNKSDAEILRLASAMMKRVEQYPVKAVVLACNTITAVCAKKFRAEYPFKIFGIEPAVRPALKNGGKTLVLATSRTIHELQNRGVGERADLFAPILLAETIECSTNPDALNIEKHLPPDRGYKNVVLGCTHYPLVFRQISDRYPRARIWDGNDGLARHVFRIVKAGDDGCTNDLGGAQNMDFLKIKPMFEKQDENRLKSRFYQLFAQKDQKIR